MSKYLKNLLSGADLSDVLIVSHRNSTDNTYGNVLKLPRLPYPIWEQIIIPVLCLYFRAKVLLSPYNSAPMILPKSTRRVTVIHDLIFLNQTLARKNVKMNQSIGALYRKLVLKYLINKMDDIIVVSRYTAKCICEMFGEILEDKILLVQNTTSVSVKCAQIKNLETNVGKKFVFSVSGIAPHKNINQLIASFKASQLRETHKLIIAGLSKKEQNIIIKNASLQKSIGKIKFVTNLSDEEICFLHQNCDLFVSNSLDEGFGIPLLDSLKQRKLICCSDITVYREIAKDNVHYFNPELQPALTRLLDKHAQGGLLNLNKFDFESYEEAVLSQRHDLWSKLYKYNE